MSASRADKPVHGGYPGKVQDDLMPWEIAPIESADPKPAALATRPVPQFAASFDDEVTD